MVENISSPVVILMVMAFFFLGLSFNIKKEGIRFIFKALASILAGIVVIIN